MKYLASSKFYLILLIGAAIFLDRLDLTIVNIALPHFSVIFNISVTQLDWISNAFLIALACFIPLSGWLADRYGLKRIFLLSIFIFSLGTFLCALSWNLTSMILFRFIQGIGGALLLPVGMAIVYKNFSAHQYASITSFIFLPSLIAPAVAPFLGALLLTYLSWHWIFLMALPICFLIFIGAAFLLKKEEEVPKEKTPWDPFGIILTASLLTAGQLFLSIWEKQGITLSMGLLLMLVLFLGYGWYRWERHFPYPLVNFQYFKKPSFMAANLLQLAFQASHFGSFFLIGLYLQMGLGFSPMEAGIIMGMQALGAIATIRLSVSLYHGYGASLPITVGLTGVGILSAAILLCLKNNSMETLYLGMGILFLRGIFSGLCGTPIQTLGMVSFEKKDMAPVNAIFNTSRQVAISLGIALSSFLITSGEKISQHALTTIPLPYSQAFFIFLWAFLLIPCFCAFGIVVNAQMTRKIYA